MSGTAPDTASRSAGEPAELGIFARVFSRPTAAGVAAAVAEHGFTTTQLNLSAFGRPTIPDPPTDPTHPDGPLDHARVRADFAAAGVRVWGVSATYNTIHPDVATRRRRTAAAAAFIPYAAQLGAEVVTLCTGTRDTDDIWRRHPGNDEPAAWHDLRETLDVLLPAAEGAGVRLGVEPEPGNVVTDAGRAGRLLTELGSDAHLVGIVLDPANLLDPATAGDQKRILTAAFDALGDSVVCLHAKDVVTSGYAAAGTGLLDYDLVLALHATLPRRVPVIVQDATEDDVPRVRDFLRAHGPVR
ncbi:Sugar phosphate isomerase/epimerase [Actinopolymorpha cephalotaxi]|uniref:Sugar phosphate isomerase/epimerase n=1 Tax=Actinopolymorpha cephalotaxi TaxID=504797 RepID=A0A1I2VFH3_9ACTN|nr:sugar phosphate isomerase/epimerase [Actinopolymorpha cephalotaxi]NYH84797.1 sugar phosphate isomerase/epimerase [Actinopolymorpha cephalotaxi]SFG85921.1 Sugar phosphate isomerase/epimerase [Actinopolymorpha cephalotaxi]